MRRAAIPLIVLLYSLGAQPAHAQDLLYTRTALDQPPVWVSAERALRGGGLDLTLFQPGDREDLEKDLERLVKAPPPGADGCSVGIAHGIVARTPGAPANHTLEDLVSEYDEAYLGEVEGTVSGFYRGILGSLVRVRLSQTLREQATSADIAYLFLETGRVSLQGRTLCKKGPRGQLPEASARIMFFYRDSPLAERENPVIFLEDETVFFSLDGNTSLPGSMARRLPGDFRITFDELVTKTESPSQQRGGDQ